MENTLRVRLDFHDGIVPDELATLVNSIISNPVRFVVFGQSGVYQSNFIFQVEKAGHPMTFPAMQTFDEVRDDIVASKTTVAPVAGLTAAQKAKADKKAKEELEAANALLAALDTAAVYRDAAGNEITESEFKLLEAAKNKENDELKNAMIPLDSEGNPLSAEKIKQINIADGENKVLMAKYIACLGDLEQAVTTCQAIKVQADAEASRATNLRIAEADNTEEAASAEKKSSSKTTTVAIVLVVLVIGGLVFGIWYYVHSHHAFDDVYGHAQGRSTYANPVYGGGGAPIGEDGGYLGVGAPAEKKKGGLVRQESMC